MDFKHIHSNYMYMPNPYPFLFVILIAVNLLLRAYTVRIFRHFMSVQGVENIKVAFPSTVLCGNPEGRIK